MKNSYLDIDEKKNTINSLTKSVQFLESAKHDLYDWKWFIISIHHAVHGFMLIALKNSNGSGVWENVVLGNDGNIDLFNHQNRLLSFMKAFKAIQDSDKMKGFLRAKSFKAKPYHISSMQHLNNRLRNEFMHYRPHGWRVNNQYFIDIAEPVIEIIEFLCFESGRCILMPEDEDVIRNAIKNLRENFVYYRQEAHV